MILSHWLCDSLHWALVNVFNLSDNSQYYVKKNLYEWAFCMHSIRETFPQGHVSAAANNHGRPITQAADN